MADRKNSGSIRVESAQEKRRKKLPNFVVSVRLKYVKLGYHYVISNAMYLMLIPLIGTASAHLSTISMKELVRLWENLKFDLVSVTLCSSLMVFLGTLYFMSRPRGVYLVDFACYKPDVDCKCTREIFVERSGLTGSFTEENLSFQKKILERSGLGQKTYLPPAILSLPPRPCMAAAREEAEQVMFGAIDQLLAKTGVKAKDIGILVVHPNSYALVVSMENITLNWYFGNNRSMLVSNCLFRMGGAAILLSNRSGDRRRAKYQLVHTVRTHKGADDKSYSCVFQEEDETKRIGVALSKRGRRGPEDQHHNTRTLSPSHVRTASFLCNLGRAVLDELEKNLELSDWHMEPSRMTLYRFGNTSSSSLWYELAYTEAKGRIKKGDRTWQIAFGSGFKCNSAVWRALRTINPAKENNPWMDEIHDFPVHVPKVAPIAS
ncbi:3-ketoacyl-CoA synthase 11 [Glycine soja]|uniref:3-ketoacyl-CoA synthase n=1 Tax=Glycine soja TaxID=3848 RepID=A0A0B2PQW2_GLYSO|nr:3-ketoacyl-CoA synthase 11 [Glycine soja]